MINLTWQRRSRDADPYCHSLTNRFIDHDPPVDALLTSDEFGLSWILIWTPCRSAASFATSASSFTSAVFIITSFGIPWAILIHLRRERRSKQNVWERARCEGGRKGMEDVLIKLFRSTMTVWTWWQLQQTMKNAKKTTKKSKLLFFFNSNTINMILQVG